MKNVVEIARDYFDHFLIEPIFRALEIVFTYMAYAFIYFLVHPKAVFGFVIAGLAIVVISVTRLTSYPGEKEDTEANI